jgi:hypothetical protein
MFVDFHMPDHADQAPPGTPPAFQDLDPEAIAGAAHRAGVEVLVFYAKDNQGNFHYPTELGHQLSDLNGRDLVDEFVRALRPRGIRAVAYFQPIRDKRTFDGVPAWRQVLNDGTERIEQGFLQLGAGGHRLVCPFGGAGDAALAQLRELVGRYDLDGVWWDRVGDMRGTAVRYPCLCESCRRQFRNETGQEIPREAQWGSPVWRVFLEWRSRGLLRFQRAAREVVREHGRGAVLVSNYAFFGMILADPMLLSVDMEAVAEATDVASLEYQHMRSYLHMSSHPRLIRALRDGPCEMIAWNNAAMGDGVVRSRVATEAAVHTFLALGHAAMVHDTADHQGRIDPRTFEMVEEVFGRAQRMDAALNGSQTLEYAAVLFSPRTYTWYGKGEPEAYVQEFMGSFRQLLEAHVPFAIISDRHLTPERLRPLKLLVLPDAACLEDEACATLRGWVEGGGVLVASHQTSRWTGAGTARADFALADLFGVSFERAADDTPRWMRARPGPLAEAGWDEHPVALRGRCALVRPLPGTAVLADLASPLPGMEIFAHFVPPEREWGPHPAVTCRELGRGRVYYIAGSLGAADLQWGVPELTGPLQVALRTAAPAPVRAEAPASVEVIARQRSDGGLLVHLINLQGETGRTHRMVSIPPRPRGIGSVLPVYDVSLFTLQPVRSARDLLSGADLPVERSGAGSRVLVPRLEVTACIALDVDGTPIDGV